MDFGSYIRMGGHALNVWGAYGIGLIGYGALMAHALWKYERLRRREKALEKK